MGIDETGKYELRWCRVHFFDRQHLPIRIRHSCREYISRYNIDELPVIDLTSMGECKYCVPEKVFAGNARLIMMPYPREILNRLKWKEGSLKGVKVTYVDRGTPGDILTIHAEEIISIGALVLLHG